MMSSFTSPKLGRLQASDQIMKAKEIILSVWERKSCERMVVARKQGKLSLRDSVPEFIDALVLTLRCPDPESQAEANAEIAREHGADRAEGEDYSLEDMIIEYHILRSVIIDILETNGDYDSETRQVFHAFMDRGMRKASVRFLELENRRNIAEEQNIWKKTQSILEESVKTLQNERELRERFVATLTHDLRTPLTAAKMSAQLLHRKKSEPENVEKLARRIIGSIDRTENMVQNLLDANRIKAGEGIPLNVEPCDLYDIVRASLEELVVLHGPRFQVQKEAHTIEGYWDANAIRRVIENLGSNAVKYGRLKSQVIIVFSETNDSVEISVMNEGDVISEADQTTIFDGYRRTQSALKSGQQGWGIGLMLVKGIVEAHRGSVQVQSTVEKGTTFKVKLPKDCRSI